MYKQCKTNQSIERQRQIAKTLMKLMEKKPYAKISVSELCRECYISRNVFYKYFDDIGEVFHFMADELVLDLQRFTGDCPAEKIEIYQWEGERFFQYWYQQRHILKNIIENDLLEVLFRHIVDNACERHIAMGRMPEEMPKEYFPLVINFTLYGIESMLINWNKQNYQTSPEKMAEAYVYLLTNPLFQIKKGDSFKIL